MTTPEDAMADKIESIAFWLEDEADRIHLHAAAVLMRAAQARIAKLEGHIRDALTLHDDGVRNDPEEWTWKSWAVEARASLREHQIGGE